MTKKVIMIFIILILVIAGCAKKTVLEDVGISEMDIFEKSFDCYENGKWGKAIEGFQSYIFAYPASERTEKAQFYLADAHFNDKNYSQAIIEFNYFLNNFKNYKLRETSFYNLSFCYFTLPPSYQFDQTLTNSALSVIGDFRLEFPESQYIIEIDSMNRILLSRLEEKKLHTGNFYLKKRENKAAEVYFANIIPENLLPEYFGMYLYKYAVSLSNLHKWDEAENVLLMMDENNKYYKKAERLLNKIRTNK